jgi:hypothetical protein
VKLEVLIGGLKNPDSKVRLDVARVLGMLDEVRALRALRAHYQAETDPAVREAVAWAGKRLYAAQQAGYSTVGEIFEFFGVNRQIENALDESEEEVMRKMQDTFDADLLRMQQRASRRRAGSALAVGLGGTVIGGMMMGATMMAGTLSAGADAAQTNLSGVRPEIGKQRAPATAPTHADISIWLRRLQSEADPVKREKYIAELIQLNNPMALPHLAAVFVSDPVPKVREAAQRFGKILYWNSVYWDMQQSGWLDEEIERRLAEVKAERKTPSGTTESGAAAQDQPDDAPDVDVSEILRKANEARKRRRGQ